MEPQGDRRRKFRRTRSLCRACHHGKIPRGECLGTPTTNGSLRGSGRENPTKLSEAERVGAVFFSKAETINKRAVPGGYSVKAKGGCIFLKAVLKELGGSPEEDFVKDRH